METFYAPDEDSKLRCEQSRNHEVADVFKGLDAISGRFKTYIGIVESIEDFGENAPRGRRWRVSIKKAGT